MSSAAPHPKRAFEEALRGAQISGAAKHVGLVIALCLDRQGVAWPGRPYFESFGVPQRRLQRALPELESAGLLEVLRRSGPHGTHRYRSLIPADASSRQLSSAADATGGQLTRSTVPADAMTRQLETVGAATGGGSADAFRSSADAFFAPADAASRHELRTHEPSSSSAGRIDYAVQLIAERQLGSYSKPIGNLSATRRTFEATAKSEHGDKLKYLAALHPEWTAQELADAIDGVAPAPPKRVPCSDCGALTRCAHRRREVSP